MRNVKRLCEPDSLKRNASVWKHQLLAKIETCKKKGTQVPDKFYDKYQEEDVKAALERMYKGFCCYCESRIRVVAYSHIEHRKPKRKYPEEAFNWHNFHLACPRCNQAKAQQYNEEYPILDAVTNIPIADHLSYKFVGIYLWRWPESKSGETTVAHTKLNHKDRTELLTERTKVYHKALEVVKKIKADLGAPDASVRKQELEELCEEQYGSAVADAMGFL